MPNYQAGKDSAAGFKLDYKGEIVEESYVPLGTLDFQVELSKIASVKPTPCSPSCRAAWASAW